MPKVIDTFSQACDYWDAGQLHAAFRLFLRGAKEGDPSAQLNLAYFYGEGLSIRKNRNKELYWLRKAAKQEYAPAARGIGIIYRQSEKPNTKIIKWFLHAAQLGDGDAYYDLGRFFLEKVGNSEKAKEYLMMAVSSGAITDAGVEEATVLLEKIQDQYITAQRRRYD